MSMDAQHKWELTALNALEQAARGNFLLSMIFTASIAAKKPPDAQELLALVRETQLRLARDIAELRKITQQREEEAE